MQRVNWNELADTEQPDRATAGDQRYAWSGSDPSSVGGIGWHSNQ